LGLEAAFTQTLPRVRDVAVTHEVPS
jgi:hypothetical protein